MKAILWNLFHGAGALPRVLCVKDGSRKKNLDTINSNFSVQAQLSLSAHLLSFLLFFGRLLL